MTIEEELYTANRLVAQARESLQVHIDLLKDRDKEIETLTTERDRQHEIIGRLVSQRDDALLRIERAELALALADSDAYIRYQSGEEARNDGQR